MKKYDFTLVKTKGNKFIYSAGLNIEVTIELCFHNFVSKDGTIASFWCMPNRLLKGDNFLLSLNKESYGDLEISEPLITQVSTVFKTSGKVPTSIVLDLSNTTY